MHTFSLNKLAASMFLASVAVFIVVLSFAIWTSGLEVQLYYSFIGSVIVFIISMVLYKDEIKVKDTYYGSNNKPLVRCYTTFSSMGITAQIRAWAVVIAFFMLVVVMTLLRP